MTRKNQGDWEAYLRQEHTDFTISCDGATYRCHRLRLASNPGYFKDLLNSGFSEATNTGEVTLHIRDPEGLFELVLEHIYTETADFLTPKNLVPLFELAFYFRLPLLQNHIRDHLSDLARLNADALNVIVHQIARLILQPLPDCFICFLARSFYDIQALDQAGDCLLKCSPATLVRVLRSPEIRISSDTQLAEFIANAHGRYQFSELALDGMLANVCWERISDSDWDLDALRFFRSEKAKLLHLSSPIDGFSDAQLERRYAHYTIPMERTPFTLGSNFSMERTPFALGSNFFERAAEYGASVSEAISDPGSKEPFEITVSMNGEGGVDVDEVLVVVTPPNRAMMLWVGLYIEWDRAADEVIGMPQQDKEEISAKFEKYSGDRMFVKLVLRIPFNDGERPQVSVTQLSGVVSRPQWH
jgi:hypothetical protein